MSPWIVGRAALVAAALAACGPVTALDLSLTVNPNVTDEPSLVAGLRRLDLTVDSPLGLYPASSTWHEGDARVIDVDADGEGELLVQIDAPSLPSTPEGRLPEIRVEQGGAPDGPIEFRVDGYAKQGVAGESLAAGSLKGVYFVEGEVKPFSVLVNLKPKFRPPLVTDVFPADGEQGLDPAKVSSVVVAFSKPMSLTSLGKPGVFQVLEVQSGKEIALTAKNIAFGEVYSGGPSTAEFRFAAALNKGLHRVRVSTQAQDTSGNYLDNVPLQTGNQPFVSQFTVGGTASTTVMCPSGVCPETWCGNSGTVCGAGLECNATEKRCEPKPSACPKTCPTFFVCDSAQARCVDDCRPYGAAAACPKTSPRCDEKSGLCVK